MPQVVPLEARSFGQTEKIILAASAVCALVYLATVSRQPFPGSVIIKAAAIVYLAVLAFRLLGGIDRVLLTAALLLSATGDVLLDWNERFFIHGLIAFALAHIAYLCLFGRHLRGGLGRGGDRYALVAATLLYSGVLVWRVWPGLERLKVPVIIYVVIITTMVIVAVLAPFTSQLIGFGAVLFLISDSLLGLNKFRQPIPAAGYLIWATYYLAQCGIAMGLFREGKLGGVRVIENKIEAT